MLRDFTDCFGSRARGSARRSRAPRASAASSRLSAEDKERLKAQILDAVPADAKKVDINFENKVHVVGYKAEPELAPAGTKVKRHHYWRCDDPVEEGWQLFTHVQHEGYDKPENLDANGPLRELKGNHQVLGPDRWERGKIYADEQTFTMPADLRGPDTMVYVGIWKGDARLRIISGPNDGDNRAIIAKIKTGVAPKKEEPKHGATDIPQLFPVKLAAGEKIVIDGRGDEAAWGAAASTGPFVDVGTGRSAASYPVTGTAKVAWDNDNLYVLIEVKDADVLGVLHRQGVAAEGLDRHRAADDVEPRHRGDHDRSRRRRRQQGLLRAPDQPGEPRLQEPVRQLQLAEDGAAGPVRARGLGPEDEDRGRACKGTIDKPDDKDEGYTVEAAIPWAAFEKGAKNRPPKPGDTWRMNFYAMENNGGTGWSPILGQGNFHRASRFGRVTWSTKESLAAAAAAADGGAAGGDGGAKDGGAGDAGRAAEAGAARSRRDGGARAPASAPAAGARRSDPEPDARSATPARRSPPYLERALRFT